MSQPQTIIRRSARTSYISTIIGIALVLFMLGLVSWMVLSSKKIVKLAKESLQVDIFFKDNAREADMFQLEKKLNAEPFVKSARFKSREDVIKEFELEEGTEDLDLEDSYKELQPTIEIYLHEDYAHLDSLVRIEERLKADYGSINEFYYNKEMLDDINTNSNFLIYIILGIALLLLIVAIALINNTIRLAIYSKRLIIRSMQLVGATENFIRKPFIWNAFLQGIIASMLALGLLMGLNLYLEKQIEGLHEIQDLKIIVILFGMVTALGILISWISTYFALRKYLRLKSEYLY